MTHLLLFSVDGISCAIPLDDTCTVVRMVQPTPGPGVIGTIDFHGRIMPVISLRELFELPDRPFRLSDVLIIAQAGVAIWADGTSGVKELPYALTESIPGVAFAEGDLVVIHDLSRLLVALAAGQPLPSLHPGTQERTTAELVEEPEDERVHALLAERAISLAQPENEVHELDLVEILRFRLMYQEYAIEMKYIREVILTGEITPVPGTPDYITGICALRGEIISLVDLRSLFAIPERGLTDLNRVIVLANGTMTFGILADHITGIGTIPVSQISPPDPGSSSISEHYLLGIVNGSLIVLDAGAILADPKMVVQDSEGDRPARSVRG
jgi:purine-binding chemotaxis protein CheW